MSPVPSALPTSKEVRDAAIALNAAGAKEARALLKPWLGPIIARAQSRLIADPARAIDDLLAVDGLLLQTADGERHDSILAEAAQRVRHRVPLLADVLTHQRARARFLRGAYEECLRLLVPVARRLRPYVEQPSKLGAQSFLAWPPEPQLVASHCISLQSAAERYVGESKAAVRRCRSLHKSVAGSPGGELMATFHCGSALMCLGQLDEAEQQLRRAVALALRVGAFRLRALGFCNLGLIAARRGETGKALGWTVEARDRLAVSGDDIMVGKLLAKEAEYLRILKDPDGAAVRSEEAYRLGLECGDFETQARALAVISPACRGHEAVGRSSARLDALRLDTETLGLQRVRSKLDSDLSRSHTPRLELDGPRVRLIDGSDHPRSLDLTNRPVLWRILNILVTAQESGGDGVTAEALIQGGWPDERPSRDSGLNRVYAAISTLRRQGLGPVIERRSGRYRLTWPATRSRI